MTVIICFLIRFCCVHVTSESLTQKTTHKQAWVLLRNKACVKGMKSHTIQSRYITVLLNKLYKIFHKKIQYIINYHLITQQTHPSVTFTS